MICSKCNQEQIKFGHYKCKVCREAYMKKWEAENREKKNASSRAWDAKNKEKSVQIKKRWEEKNQTTLNEMSRKNYAIRVKEGRQKKYKTDDLVRREVKHRYRARKMNTISEKYSAREIFEKFNWTCNYCGDEAKTLDHVKPLSKGGTDTVDNLVAACKACNCSKGAKLLNEWKKINGTNVGTITDVKRTSGV